MKTIREWLEQLPEPYRTQALENAFSIRSLFDIDREPSRQTIKCALREAFIWHKTSQGHTYWADIANTLNYPHELKEIWEQGFTSYNICRPDYDSETGDAFMAGCEFENKRSKWFDPEKVLPNEDKEANYRKESIIVIVETVHNQIESAYYDFTNKEWSCDDKVISWAYIPK